MGQISYSLNILESLNLEKKEFIHVLTEYEYSVHEKLRACLLWTKLRKLGVTNIQDLTLNLLLIFIFISNTDGSFL
jgi:hypothetical protein